MIRIRVLGATEISIGHRRIGMNTEVLFALALYLTTRAGERIDREDLLERFWNQGSAEDRRHALRQMLYRLRQKGLNLDEEGEWVGVDPARVDSDLRDAIADGWPEKAETAAIDAAASFAPNFSRRIAPAFLEWLDGVRERLAAQHRRAALRQINVARREARWADLERWALPILRTDPLNEEATLARAESAAMAGSKTIALEILDNYLQEVGEISPELGKPAAQLRKRLAERRPDWATRGPKEVPLIGRTELMSRLTGLVEAAWRGEGSAVVLVGAPGIGKTRLAMEARAYAELKGMRTVVVRAEVGNSERPFALLQVLVAALLELPGSAGCDPNSLAILQRVVENRRAPESDASSTMQSVLSQLPGALRDLYASIVHELRLVLVVDDVHNCDAASALSLRGLILAAAGSRGSWILTSRNLDRGQEHADLARAIVAVRVGRLNTIESTQLAQRTSSAHNLAITDDALRALVGAAAGNPLFVRELSVARAGLDASNALPDSLQTVIANRIGLLTPVQLRLVRVVALLGSDATPSRLHSVTRLDRATLSLAVESLELDGLVHASANRALELHECWQRAVVESLEGATRSALCFECATVLESEPEAQRSPHSIWRAAELFRDAGENHRALQLFYEASDQLYSAGLPREAAQVLERSDMLVTSPEHRLELGWRMARALLAAGVPRDCIEVSRECLRTAIPSSAAERGAAALLLSYRALALVKLSKPQERELRQLVRYAGDTSLSNTTRLLVCLTGSRLSSNAQVEEFERAFFRASESIRESSGPSTLGSLVSMVFHTEYGPKDSLLACQDELLVAEASDQSAQGHCLIMRSLCNSLRFVGRFDDAIEAGERGYAIARSRALLDDAAQTAALLAYVNLDFERLDDAEKWISRASEAAIGLQYEQLNKMVEHARSRLLLQRERHSEALTDLLGRHHQIEADSVLLGRSVEVATLAFLLATSGREDEAAVVLGRALEDQRRLVGRYVGDYATEVCCRALATLGREGEAVAVATTHLTLREAKYSRPFLPFQRFLRETSERLPTRAD